MRDAPTDPKRPYTDIPEDPTNTPIEPGEGQPDMNLPGANRPSPQPDPEDDLPQRLGERIADGPGSGIATGETDLLPNTEVPQAQM